MGNRTWLVIIVFTFSLLAFGLTSAGDTAFNHFTLLADSFLDGKIYIEGNMPWLEKIPIDEDRFYVANPPMPAIISMVPVLVFGKNLPQQYISLVLGSLITALAFLISLRIKEDLRLAIWASLLIGFGSLNWYLITVGSTWYLAQVCAELFVFLAIYSQLKRKSPILTGLFLGFAYFSRIPTILLLPFFVINLPKPLIKNALLLALGITPSVLGNFLYNYFRFGVIWDIGYTLIPGISTEPWYQHGVVNPVYIVEHLKIIFLALPSYAKEFPYFVPSLFGYAIWFTSPAFVFSFFNNLKKKIVWSSWLSISLVSLLIFSHGSTGFSQFGYRFAADFYPVLLFLTILGVDKTKGPRTYHWLFLILGIVVNFWGVLFLNILK